MTLKLKTFPLFFCVSVFFSFTAASGANLSGYHQLNIDPQSAKKIGDTSIKEIQHFFHETEVALETKNIDALMDLYSDNYKNGVHDKDAVKKTWIRLFNDFDDLVTIHNIFFVNVDQANQAMFIRCTGLLMAKPKQEKESITLDTWTNSDHILTKEDGIWKIIGNFGKERKRFWFSKPLHPLF